VTELSQNCVTGFLEIENDRSRPVARLLIVNALVWSGVAAAAAAVVDAARPDAPPPASLRSSELAPLDVAEPAAPAPPALSAFAAIAERPLFSPDRRPPATVADGSPAAGAAPPPLALLGVAGFEGDRVAIARLGDETLRLRAGAAVEGWTVVGVEPRAVTLRAGAAEHRVRLGDPSPDAAAGGSAAIGAAAPVGLRGAPAIGAFDFDISGPDSEDYD
jgi:hypothetical protein